LRHKNIYIKINKWEEYNPFGARAPKRPHWFALDNDFDRSESMMGVPPITRLIFIYILCVKSRNKHEIVHIEVHHCASLWKVSPNDISMSVALLVKNQVLTRLNKENYRKITNTVQDKTIQDITGHEISKTATEANDFFGIEDLVALWNSLKSDKQRKVFRMTPSRLELARLALEAIPEKANWEKIFSGVSKSDYCNGSNPSKWIADFSWCLKLDKSLRYLEEPELISRARFK